MKNYDLSKYILRSGDVLMFPITSEELQIFKDGRETFAQYIRMPYIGALVPQKKLNELLAKVDMENDYWFMDTIWMVADIKSKEIFGTIRYEKEDEFNKIVKNLTVLLDAVKTYEDAINLFARFLSVNNYNNILVEDEKECYEG